MILDEEIFDKETIENLQYIAAVSGETISRWVEAFEQLCKSFSKSLENIEELFKSIEEVVADVPDDIPALKKQIKYCKNPMEIKMLNKRLNEAYKKKNKKR